MDVILTIKTFQTQMSFILVSGIFLRKIIISYLLAPDTNTGPINLLIWVDQVNGLFLALNIIGRIIAFVLPFPLSVLTGDTFCKWSPLPGKYIFTIFFEVSLKSVDIFQK
jgi:hypothetical protein